MLAVFLLELTYTRLDYMCGWVALFSPVVCHGDEEAAVVKRLYMLLVEYDINDIANCASSDTPNAAIVVYWRYGLGFVWVQSIQDLRIRIQENELHTFLN